MPAPFRRTLPLALIAAAALALGTADAASAQQQTAAPAGASAAALALTPEQRQLYAGSYTVSMPDGQKMVLHIHDRDGQLFGEREGDPDQTRLVNLGGHRLQVEETPDMILTFTVADGKAAKFNITVDGANLEAVRNPPAAPSAATLATPAEITPVADYHAHISSLALDRHMIPDPLPVIDLEPALAALTREREAYEQRDVSSIYATDALVFNIGPRAWMRGRKAAHDFLASLTSNLRYLPVEAQVHGDAGFIAGYISRVNGADTLRVRHFLFPIRKEGGQWRIMADISSEGPRSQREYPASDYVKELDSARIRWGVVLSTAFVFASGKEPTRATERAEVVAENDWLAAQVAEYPNRLIGFCALNPLREYAPAEVLRCANLPGMKGVKLHFQDSGVDLTNPDHLRRVQDVFRSANAAGMHITAHTANAQSRTGEDAARLHNRIFLEAVLPLAPEVIVQLAHMNGDGGWNPVFDAGFAVFADAIEAGDPRTRRLYFDASGAVGGGLSAETAELLVRRMRQVGFDRILFASDRHTRNPPPAVAWRTWEGLPISAAERAIIAGNRMPYLPE